MLLDFLTFIFLNKISNKELIEKGFSASGYNWKCSQRIYVLQFLRFFFYFLDKMLLLISLMLKVMIEYIINKEDIHLKRVGCSVEKLTLFFFLYINFFVAYFGIQR